LADHGRENANLQPLAQGQIPHPPSSLPRSGLVQLDGGRTGTLTVDGGIIWVGGLMSGEGKTILSKPAVLALPGDEARYLSGRHLINHGQTIWDATGRIHREASGSPLETYDNTGIRPAGTTTPGFDAVVIASQIYRAIFPGFTG
jgi:hypothetical protein